MSRTGSWSCGTALSLMEFFLTVCKFTARCAYLYQLLADNVFVVIVWLYGALQLALFVATVCWMLLTCSGDLSTLCIFSVYMPCRQ